jgi:hypothetical protein
MAVAHRCTILTVIFQMLIQPKNMFLRTRPRPRSCRSRSTKAWTPGSNPSSVAFCVLSFMNNVALCEFFEFFKVNLEFCDFFSNLQNWREFPPIFRKVKTRFLDWVQNFSKSKFSGNIDKLQNPRLMLRWGLPRQQRLSLTGLKFKLAQVTRHDPLWRIRV